MFSPRGRETPARDRRSRAGLSLLPLVCFVASCGVFEPSRPLEYELTLVGNQAPPYTVFSNFLSQFDTATGLSRPTNEFVEYRSQGEHLPSSPRASGFWPSLTR